MRIIGFTGKKRTGKDTAGEIAREYYESQGITTRRFAFADPMKEDILELPVCKLKGWDRDYIERHKEYFRPLLIAYGTDLVRNHVSDEYWISRTKVKLLAFRDMNPDGVAIFTDVRFRNEAQLIREFGGSVIRIRNISEDPMPELEVEQIVANKVIYNYFNHGFKDTVTQGVMNLDRGEE
jgi:hypothetical protein